MRPFLSGEVDAPAVPDGLMLAPMLRRVGGLFIDQVVVLVPVFAGALLLGYQPGDRITNTALTVFSLAATVTAFVYETVMVALIGRTLGKIAVGTRVVRAIDGDYVGWTGAAMRGLVPVAFGAIPQVGFGLGIAVYAWAFFNPLRQGIHDKAAATLVILHRAPAPAPAEP